MSDDLPGYGTIVVVGGGCYGTFYARQLLQAREREKATWDDLVIVDRDPSCRFTREVPTVDRCRLVVRDWDDFFDGWLASCSAEPPSRRAVKAGAPADMIVPSPLMPHLMYQWLLRRARARWPRRRVETRPCVEAVGTPYDVLAPDGTRYISFADWLCPTHCVEPAICPVTRGPRTWEMEEALEQVVRRLGPSRSVAGPVVFHCAHQVHGVGAFPVDAVLAGDEVVTAAGAEGRAVDVLVGTVSSCHGAVNLLHLGPGD
jgi:hypothetical protein